MHQGYSISINNSSYLYDTTLARDTTDLINQGYRYRDYFQIFKNLKHEIDDVTIWGLANDDSWLNPSVNTVGCTGITANNSPLPFDAYLQHKFAYTGLVKPLALPGANLVTTVSASAGTINPGKQKSFVITVANEGPNDAASLTFTDSVPATTQFLDFSAPAGWTCQVPAFHGTGQVSCTAVSLANGATAQFTLKVMATRPTPPGSVNSDSATVTSTTLNPNPEPQNTGSVNFVVAPPN
jgi:uncharacterized repeat protein (TIGR01451 family)